MVTVRVMTGITVQRRFVVFPVGTTISDEYCITDPDDCCEGSGSGSGSGSDGSGSTGPPCPVICVECELPESIVATVSGITNGFCTGCEDVNGSYTLTHVTPGSVDDISVPGGCTWQSEDYDSGCGSVTGPIILYRGLTGWHLQMGIGANGGVVGTLQGEWLCEGTNTFLISESDLGEYCQGSVTVEIYIDCGGSGSGSGGGGSGDITDCTDCDPDGAASEYTAVVSGFTGACTDLNTTWVFTHSVGCSWTATPSLGLTATMTIGTNKVYSITFNGSGGQAIYDSLEQNDCCSAVELLFTSSTCGGGEAATVTLTPTAGCSGGSGSGSGSGTTDCSSCSDSTPDQWTLEPSSFGGDCAVFNTTLILSRPDPVANPCWWEYESGSELVQLYFDGAYIHLVFSLDYLVVGYYRQAWAEPQQCVGVEYILDFVVVTCSAYPSQISVQAV